MFMTKVLTQALIFLNHMQCLSTSENQSQIPNVARMEENLHANENQVADVGEATSTTQPFTDTDALPAQLIVENPEWVTELENCTNVKEAKTAKWKKRAPAP